ncbi:MAG: type I restriction endonuclease subunit R [Candidatus Omnitrophota bacterium]
MNDFTESEVELFSINELKKLDFFFTPGAAISPLTETNSQPFLIADPSFSYNQAEKRTSYSEVILKDTLEHAINRLNPTIPETGRQEALKIVTNLYAPQLIEANEEFHKLLTEGVPVTIRKKNQDRGERVWLLDFQNPLNNVFYTVNQFTVQQNNQQKRPDLIVFVNGLPLIVFEFKKPDQKEAIRKAYDQIQTYKTVIPSLFYYNAFCIISDGMKAKVGTISSGLSRFQVWKTIDSKIESSLHISQLEILIKGMLNKNTLLDLIRNFIVFDKEKKVDPKSGLTQIETIKKIAAYHQYHAVNKAIESTCVATSTNGNRKAGVIWHTQGSGKSLTMVFYTGKLIHTLANPTIVVITDRNDLDDQLFEIFANTANLLNQKPVNAKNRDHLKALLKVSSGGIVFTTIQKFFPEDDQPIYDQLSDRRNIIIIADEAHRTQYGLKAKLIDSKDQKGKRITYGFAKYLRDALPNATFIGFTGTPIESTDINTPAVFGNYIDIYDIAQSVEDGATVKIYYESRIAKVNITDQGRKLIEEFDQDTSSDNTPETQKSKARWTQLETIIGHPERLKNLARDIISHFEKRLKYVNGKAMIVTMTRRIAIALYKEIIALKPLWHHDDLNKGMIKIVMTSDSSDKPEVDPEDPDGLVIPMIHRTNKESRKLLAARMKDPEDPLKLVIVVDMWLTGFDVPCLHTLYIDKLMKNHNLMQTIARVNRVFLDKPGGLIVDYIGFGTALREALSFYSNSGGKGEIVETQEKAVERLKEKMEVVRAMFHGFDYSPFFGDSTSERFTIILKAMEFILSQDQGKERFNEETTVISKLFALASSHPDAMAFNAEIAFFQSVRARFFKFESSEHNTDNARYGTVIRQIINEALESTEVVDVFDAAGLKKPEISLISEEFLNEIKQMKHQNVAVELLRKILNDAIKTRTTFNLVGGQKLMEMLEKAIIKYRNNQITTLEVIEELMEIAGKIRSEDEAQQKLELTRDEYAFYKALGINESAVKVLGNGTLAEVSRIIADKVRTNATIDWAMKESARAKLKAIVKRVLNKYGYPSDKQEKAVDTVLKQAEVMADYWIGTEDL